MEGSRFPIQGPTSADAGARRFFRSMGIAASGLSAQRARIDVIANNIANAETTRTADGSPYRRQVVQLQEIPFSELMSDRVSTENVPGPRGGGPAGDPESGGVRVLGRMEDVSEGALVYDPGHPDANPDGYVQMPNVNITDEIVDLMEARRLYEANASVFDAVKSMLKRAAQL